MEKQDILVISKLLNEMLLSLFAFFMMAEKKITVKRCLDLYFHTLIIRFYVWGQKFSKKKYF